MSQYVTVKIPITKKLRVICSFTEVSWIRHWLPVSLSHTSAFLALFCRIQAAGTCNSTKSSCKLQYYYQYHSKCYSPVKWHPGSQHSCYNNLVKSAIRIRCRTLTTTRSTIYGDGACAPAIITPVRSHSIFKRSVVGYENHKLLIILQIRTFWKLSNIRGGRERDFTGW